MAWWTHGAWSPIARVEPRFGEAATGVGTWWVAVGWPWLSAWIATPGFGGVAAVAAALIALTAARRKTRMDAWWQRAEWALNLYVGRDNTAFEREVGAAALVALQRSALGGAGEQDFLIAVVDAVTLDPEGDGDETDDLAASKAQSEHEGAYLAHQESAEEANDGTDGVQEEVRP